MFSLKIIFLLSEKLPIDAQPILARMHNENANTGQRQIIMITELLHEVQWVKKDIFYRSCLNQYFFYKVSCYSKVIGINMANCNTS